MTRFAWVGKSAVNRKTLMVLQLARRSANQQFLVKCLNRLSLVSESRQDSAQSAQLVFDWTAEVSSGFILLLKNLQFNF